MGSQVELNSNPEENYRSVAAILGALGAVVCLLVPADAQEPVHWQEDAQEVSKESLKDHLSPSAAADLRPEIKIEVQSAPPSAAVAPAAPLSFRAWRDQQVLAAQNHHARVSNRLTLFRSGKIGLKDSAPLKGSELTAKLKLPKGARTKEPNFLDRLRALEAETQVAKNQLEIAQELTMDDYVVGHLTQFRDQPEAMAVLVNVMSKDELTELLKIMAETATPPSQMLVTPPPTPAMPAIPPVPATTAPIPSSGPSGSGSGSGSGAPSPSANALRVLPQLRQTAL